MKPFSNRGQRVRQLFGVLCLLLALAPFGSSAGEARMEVITLESQALKNNPLHDPSTRLIPVFLPAQATNGARLPVVY